MAAFFPSGKPRQIRRGGSTLQFDWLNAVFAEYEELLTLPVKNIPYYLIGDRTAASLNAKSAVIHATWDRANNHVTLSADKSIPRLCCYGYLGWRAYGGQFVREVAIDNTPEEVSD